MIKKTTYSAPDASTGTVKSLARENPSFADKRAVAEMLGVSPRTVNSMMAQGMPHVKLGSRRTRFDLAEVHSWVLERYGVQRRAVVCK